MPENPERHRSTCFTVVGQHPLRLGGRDFAIVQPGHQLYLSRSETKGQVDVLLCDSAVAETAGDAPPTVLRDLGTFSRRAGQVLQGEQVIEGVACAIEIRISQQLRGHRRVLTGTIFPNAGADGSLGEDEDATGGWSAEAQGGDTTDTPWGTDDA